MKLFKSEKKYTYLKLLLCSYFYAQKTLHQAPEYFCMI